MKRSRVLTSGAIAIVLLTGCARPPGLQGPGCVESLTVREKHREALVNPPTANDDLLTGAQLLAVLEALCGEGA